MISKFSRIDLILIGNRELVMDEDIDRTVQLNSLILSYRYTVILIYYPTIKKKDRKTYVLRSQYFKINLINS